MTIKSFRTAKALIYFSSFILLFFTINSLAGKSSQIKNKNFILNKSEIRNEIRNKVAITTILLAANTEKLNPPSCTTSIKSKKIIAITNNARSETGKCGHKRKRTLNKLKHSCALSTMALNHAIELYERNTLDHHSSDGAGISERAEKLGIQWKALGENIAAGYTSAESVHADWLNSRPHCKNIMNPAYNRIGVAEYHNYWVVIFSQKR